jgi:hypothetical protein
MDRRIPLVALWLGPAIAACGGVKVVPLGAEIRPRPADCAVEFLEKPPARPYDAIAELTATTNPGDGEARQVLRRPACELGADAVVITRRVVTNALGHTLISGTAIRYGPQKPAEIPPSAERLPDGATSL